MDNIISVAIPSQEFHLDLYDVVEKYMSHGTCRSKNTNSLYMLDGRCARHFLKKYIAQMTIDANGYPLYERDDSGSTIEKDGVLLDNKF